MADNTINHNNHLWLTNDSWATIASFLDDSDFVKFKHLCKFTQFISSQAVILQPFYNRLYAIDNTLPPMLLQEEDTLAAFKQAFEKIHTQQQSEITYLTQHHPNIMKKTEYEQVFQEKTTMSLKLLEAKSAALDKVNSEIIEKIIDQTSSSQLYLISRHITRLPVTLFQNPTYADFWKKLTHLSCCGNQLTVLNVQELTALQSLFCDNNQLIELKVQGLPVLQKLFCHNNQLIKLNAQGLIALENLWCNDNQLIELNVQGLTALRKLWCDNNQLIKLNTQGLIALEKLWCNDNQLIELNVQGLTALRKLWCDNNQLIELNVQEMTALRKLWCNNNQLTGLNVQGRTTLEHLDCDNNPLHTLILTGAHAATKNKHAELERKLLFNKLRTAQSPQARRAIVRRLGTDYTPENCLKYYSPPIYAEKSLTSNFANSVSCFTSSTLSQISAFLPSFATTNTGLLKRKRDQEIDTEELSKESDHQSDLKKRKKK